MYPKALDAFGESMRYASLLGSDPLIMEGYLNMADLYRKTGDFRREAENLRKYYGLKDSLFNLETKNRLTELEAAYQINKKNMEVVKLDTAVIKQRNQRNIFIILVLTSTIIPGILVCSLRRLQAKQKLPEEKSRQINPVA